MFPQGLYDIVMPFYFNYKESEEYFYLHMKWQMRFVLWPRRCRISKRRLWLEFAYYGHKQNYYKPETWYAWHAADEHLIWRLKNNDR